MDLAVIFSNSKKVLQARAPEILTTGSVVGVFTTAYLTGKASWQAGLIVQHTEGNEGTHGEPREMVKERVKLVWKLYIPAGVSAGLTTISIIGSNKASGRRTAAAVAAYSLTERAFSEYKDKVIEEIGKGKEQTLRDSIAQDKVNKSESREVIVVGKGDVLCCELYTGRYFRSDMESLRKAQNEVNARIINMLYVTIAEFYDIVGLPYTSKCDIMGWTSDKLMDMQFSTVLSPDGEPCLAFDYNYLKPV